MSPISAPSSPPLPSSTSPHLALLPSTPSEQHSVLLANSSAFRGPLTVSAYLRREAHLASQALTCDGGLTGWVLVDTLAEPRKVLCSCETIRKRALLARGGEVREVVCHGVASVFCEEGNRRRGYAGRMMRELGKVLRTWQAGEGEVAFTVLFSDIGKKYYAAYGWQPYPSSHIALPKTSSRHESSEKIQLLYESSVEELCAADEVLMRKDFERLARDHTDIYVTLIPDAKTMQWHHAREPFIAHELNLDPPLIKGALMGSEIGKRAWCIWTRKWGHSAVEDNGNTLFILRLVIEDRDGNESEQIDQVTNLLAEAQLQAQVWDMREVQIWNPSSVILQAAKRLLPTAVFKEREEDSITSLMWYGDGVGLDDGSAKLIWLGNEKYGWC
ncbi:MAG: hypothetical protein M1835_003945 [Candelina submexicana]|nr:MAG: hypothetical protein M1835_003945 [Candelina submexicana]